MKISNKKPRQQKHSKFCSQILAVDQIEQTGSSQVLCGNFVGNTLPKEISDNEEVIELLDNFEFVDLEEQIAVHPAPGKVYISQDSQSNHTAKHESSSSKDLVNMAAAAAHVSSQRDYASDNGEDENEDVLSTPKLIVDQKSGFSTPASHINWNYSVGVAEDTLSLLSFDFSDSDDDGKVPDDLLTQLTPNNVKKFPGECQDISAKELPDGEVQLSSGENKKQQQSEKELITKGVDEEQICTQSYVEYVGDKNEPVEPVGLSLDSEMADSVDSDGVKVTPESVSGSQEYTTVLPSEQTVGQIEEQFAEFLSFPVQELPDCDTECVQLLPQESGSEWNRSEDCLVICSQMTSSSREKMSPVWKQSHKKPPEIHADDSGARLLTTANVVDEPVLEESTVHDSAVKELIPECCCSLRHMNVEADIYDTANQNSMFASQKYYSQKSMLHAVSLVSATVLNVSSIVPAVNELTLEREVPETGLSEHSESVINDLPCQQYVPYSMQDESKADEAIEHNQSSQTAVDTRADNGNQDQNLARKSSRLSRPKQMKSNATASESEVSTNAELQQQPADTEMKNVTDKELEPKEVRRSLRIRGQPIKQLTQMEKSVYPATKTDCSSQEICPHSVVITVVKKKISQPNKAAGIDDEQRVQNSARKSSKLSRRKAIRANTTASEVEIETNVEPQLLQANTETLLDANKEMELQPVQRSPRTCRQQKKQMTQMEKSVAQTYLTSPQHERVIHTSATEKLPMAIKPLEPKLAQRTLPWKKRTGKAVSQNTKQDLFQQEAETHRSVIEGKQLMPESVQRSSRARGQLETADNASNLGLYSSKTMVTEPSTCLTAAEQRMNRILAFMADLNNEDEKSDKEVADPCSDSDVYEIARQNSMIASSLCYRQKTMLHAMSLVGAAVQNVNGIVPAVNECTSAGEDPETGHREHSISVASQKSIIGSEYAGCFPLRGSSQSVENEQQLQQQVMQNVVEAVGGISLEENEIHSSLSKMHSQILCCDDFGSEISQTAAAQQHCQNIGSHAAQQLRETQHEVAASSVDYSSPEVIEIPNSLTVVNSNDDIQAVSADVEDDVIDLSCKVSQAAAWQCDGCQHKCSCVVSEYSCGLQAVQKWQEMQQQVPTSADYGSPEMNEIPNSFPEIHSQIHYNDDVQKQAVCANRKVSEMDRNGLSHRMALQQNRRQKCSVVTTELSFGLQTAPVSTTGVEYNSPELNEIPSSLPLRHSQKQTICKGIAAPVQTDSMASVGGEAIVADEAAVTAESQYVHNASTYQSIVVRGSDDGIGTSNIYDGETRDDGACMNAGQCRKKVSEPQLTWMLPSIYKGLHGSDADHSSTTADDGDGRNMSDSNNGEAHSECEDVNVRQANVPRRRVKSSEPLQMTDNASLDVRMMMRQGRQHH